MTLYGFLAEQDVEIFRLLIGVNGVGPKAALSILSHLSLEELQEAVYSGDSKKISAAQGIGVKTAQKIILDLKDKISKFSPYSHILLKQQETMQEQKNLQEAKDALTSLGYGKKEINFAVGQIDCLSEMTTEEVLKLILERLAK
ncbi:hypothetical protein FACS189418_8700 [Clostridia bacterium]|nr:hypothetical protein FACS189418_8700 [Clostridia bacterium]